MLVFVLVFNCVAFIVELEQPSYTILEGESVEVCLVNITNPERVTDFYVHFYTSYECDVSSTAEAAVATGI